MTRTILVALAAAVASFLLLQAALIGWRLTGLFFLALPFALSGGVLAFVVDDGELSIGAAAGLLTIFGVAVASGLVLIDGYQRARRAGEPAGRELVREETRSRVRAILASTVAIAGVLIPILFVGEEAGLELAYPFAVVVLGGLVTALVFALFVVPALYVAAAPARDEEAL